MASFIRLSILASGGIFILIGLLPFFAPERFGEVAGLTVDTPAGGSTIRSMIGAHYLAMGGMCIFGVLRKQTSLLTAVGLIEGTMVIARIIGMLSGDGGLDVLVLTGAEIGAAGLLLWMLPKVQL